MQKLVALLLIAVLAGSITIPNVFSDDGNNANGNNENDNQGNQNNAKENENDNHGNQNDTKTNDNQDNKENETKVHFGSSNATSITITLPNGTKLTFGFSNGTNPGQQISAFINKIHQAFEQEEKVAKQTIKDCRQKARDASSPADKKAIMDQCKIELKQVNQQFKGEHKLFQLDFKQFRETVIGNNLENHEKPEKDNGTKIKNTALVIPPHVLEKPHGKNSTQNTIPPNHHGMDEKQKHANQNDKQKRGKKD